MVIDVRLARVADHERARGLGREFLQEPQVETTRRRRSVASSHRTARSDDRSLLGRGIDA
jgi:hypothetical protein